MKTYEKLNLVTGQILKVEHLNHIEQGIADANTLSPATKDTLGGIIVGDGLTIDENGKLSVSGSAEEINDFATMQKQVQAGNGPSLFPIGTQISVPHASYGNIIFDVVSHNGYKKPNDSSAHTMTLLMHDAIRVYCVDAPEAIYAVTANNYPDGMPAGTYNIDFTEDSFSNTWAALQFTITKTIPVGGIIMFSDVYQVDNKTISTYASCASTTPIESEILMTDGSGGTYLGAVKQGSDVVNQGWRIRYGSNHYGESAIRQWINTNKPANTWWTPQTQFDRAPSYAENTPGFLYGIDPNFLEIIGEVDVITDYNYSYNANGIISGTYTTRDKFFLPSISELAYKEGNEGTAFAYYNGASDVDRIKYDISNASTPRALWTRSSSGWDPSHMNIINTSGAREYRLAQNDDTAIAVACVVY